MKVLHVCSELYPLLKTGGSADVMGSLPFAQKEIGIDARILLPAYPAISAGVPQTDVVAESDNFAGHIVSRYGEYEGIGIYLIDAPHLYARKGNPCHDAGYADYADNYKRFALLGKVGAELAAGLDGFWHAEVVHSRDWHAGLAAAYLFNEGRPAKSVFTIHNLVYQGQFNGRHLTEIGLPESMFRMHGLELFEQISYSKAGVYYSDVITTVSPTYAREATTPEFAYGLQGLLSAQYREGRLVGILNGVNKKIRRPDDDQYIWHAYSAEDMGGKEKNKAELQVYFNLPQQANALLFVMITRLTGRKDMDLSLESADEIVKQDGQLAILGSGVPHLEDGIRKLAEDSPQRIAVRIGYDEALSHLMIAGGDVILVPSRSEPCGLAQLYGLKYGILPLVRATGDLVDTVVDACTENIQNGTATSFVFTQPTAADLRQVLQATFDLWRQQHIWTNTRATAMRQGFSWTLSITHYGQLYRKILFEQLESLFPFE